MASNKKQKNKHDLDDSQGAAHIDAQAEHDDHEENHRHEPHEEGEPWLVSYADMMTLLFGFFVVMYSFAVASPKNEDCVRLKLMEAFKSEKAQAGDSTDEASQNSAMRALELLVTMLNLESIEEVISRIQDAEERARQGEGEGAESRDKETKLVTDDLKAIMGAEEIKDLVTVSVPVDILFDQGSTKLKPAAFPRLNELSQTIGRANNIDSVRIVGHTDSTTNDAVVGLDSWSLSVVRASQVANYLTANAVKKKIVRVEGRGSSEPLLPEKTTDGKWIAENMKKNRRIEILISKDRKYVR
jgi:chemotaxis protein MotB